MVLHRNMWYGDSMRPFLKKELMTIQEIEKISRHIECQREKLNSMSNSNETDMKQFEFDTVFNKSVKMTPMNLLFPRDIIDELRNIDIREGYCYRNAVMVAKFLEEQGYEIDVVEGYYRPCKRLFNICSKVYNTRSNEWLEHRWCKKGNYYFDPTYYLGNDILFGSNDFEYRAERLYYAEDLLDFAHKVSDDFKITGSKEEDIFWCSSLNGASSIDGGITTKYFAIIDNDFNYSRVA